jgi:hypothetical protein
MLGLRGAAIELLKTEVPQRDIIKPLGVFKETVAREFLVSVFFIKLFL